MSNEDNVITCSSGIQVRVRPVSLRLLEQYDKSHIAPEPPTIDVEAAGGVMESVPNDSDPEYQRQVKAFQAKSTDDMLRLLMTFGLSVDLPADEQWIDDLEYAGIKVDRKHLLNAYLEYIVMSSYVADLSKLMSAVMRTSGVAEEDIAAWQKLF